MILLLYILNLFDAASTHYLVSTGQATEANPLMHLALSTSWWWFWSVKAGIVGALCLVLTYYKNEELTIAVTAFGVVAYSALALRHVSILL